MSAFEYVARCRHWKQFRLDRQQAIQSQPSSSGQLEEAHLPVPVFSTGSSQQLQNPLPLPSEQREWSESSSTGRSTASTSAVVSTGLRPEPPAGTQQRAQELPSASSLSDTVIGPPNRSSVSETNVSNKQPPNSTPQQFSRSEPMGSSPGRYFGDQQSSSYQAPPRGRMLQNEGSVVEQNSAVALSRPPPKQTNVYVPQRHDTEPAMSEISPEMICRVCMDNPFNVVLVPCGHLAVCASCAERCKDCPICRRPIRGTVRIQYTQ